MEVLHTRSSYKCNFCFKVFKSAQALGGHMNIHREQKALMRSERNHLSAASSSLSASADIIHDDQRVALNHHHHQPLSVYQYFYPEASASATFPFQGLSEENDKKPEDYFKENSCGNYQADIIYNQPQQEYFDIPGKRKRCLSPPDESGTVVDYCQRSCNRFVLEEEEKLDLELRLGFSSPSKKLRS